MFYKDSINCAKFNLNRSIWNRIKGSDLYAYLVKKYKSKKSLVFPSFSNNFNAITATN